MAENEEAPEPGGDAQAGPEPDDRSVVHVHGQAYDVSNFDDHPGGRSFIETVIGKDATAYFEAHHLRIERARARLAKLPRVDLPGEEAGPADLDGFGSAAPGFASADGWDWNPGGFHTTLRHRVAAQLLRQVGHPTTDEEEIAAVDKAIWRRATSSTRAMKVTRLFAIALYLAAFLVACATQHPAAAMAAGVMTAVMGGFGHSAFHQRGRTWDCWLFELAGMSHKAWREGEHAAHHVNTNLSTDPETTGMAPFIIWGPPARIRKFSKIRRVSQLLAFHFVAALGVLAQLAQSLTKRHPLSYRSGLVAPVATLGLLLISGSLLAVHPELRVLAPGFGDDVALGTLHAFGMWVLMWMSGSFHFILVDVVTHNQERNLTVKRSIHRDWGAWQLETCTDIEIPCGLRGVPLFGMFFVFLHEQTLHHLFPSLDHSRLPSLRPLVLRTAEEFGLALHPPQGYCRLYLGMLATIAGISASEVHAALASKTSRAAQTAQI